MHANPSTMSSRAALPMPAPRAATPEHGLLPVPGAARGDDPAPGTTRRPTRGDLLTVDPSDRHRRAQTALLELMVSRSVGRRRG